MNILTQKSLVDTFKSLFFAIVEVKNGYDEVNIQKSIKKKYKQERFLRKRFAFTKNLAEKTRSRNIGERFKQGRRVATGPRMSWSLRSDQAQTKLGCYTATEHANGSVAT